MKQFIVDIKDYSLDDFKYYLKSSPPVICSDRARERIIRSRETLENILARKATTIYGINTGFGKLSSVRLAALAATEMGNISERRIFALLNGNAGLPAGLVSKSGLNSGLMMVQVTAAALAVPAILDVSASPWTERRVIAEAGFQQVRRDIRPPETAEQD